MSKPYAEMLSLSNVSRAKARDIRGFMHVVADCFSPLDVILRKCRLSLTKACRRRIYAFRNRTVSFSTGLGRHSFSCAAKLRLPIPRASALAREEFSYPRLFPTAVILEAQTSARTCRFCRTPTRHELLLALDVHPERRRFAKQDGTQRRIYSISKLHDSFLPVWVGHF